jgi:protein-disulfide isomerase
MEERKNQGLTLPMSILIAAVLISGSIIYLVGSKNRPPSPSPAQVAPSNVSPKNLTQLLSIRERDVILGNQNAPVTLVEYGDYQCPFCGRFFNQTEPLLREEYISSGKVKMIYRDLAFLGPESQAAAEAAECAKDQGKFWAYHDELFKEEIADGSENNGNLDRSLFLKLAERVGLNISDFTSCLDGKKYADFVRQVTREAQSLGINATPTSFVNGELIQGAQPYNTFRAAIEKHLNQ